MFLPPNASRTVRAAWERQGAGYYRQWAFIAKKEKKSK